jgi:hypothetical protein
LMITSSSQSDWTFCLPSGYLFPTSEIRLLTSISARLALLLYRFKR